MTGAVVTGLLLREGWVDKYPLFFPVDVKEDVTDDDDLGFIDRQYINLKVDYTDGDEQRMIEAAKCYTTQFTAAEIRELIDVTTQNKTNIKYFRKFEVSQKTMSGFWN